MSCSIPPADPSKRLADLERKARQLSTELNVFRSWTGIPQSLGAFVVTMLSADYDAGTDKFTLVWVSEPGFTYQIQSSEDGTTWAKEANVEGAEDAVQTSWLSGVYEMADLPIFFRVLRYPSAMPVCTPT